MPLEFLGSGRFTATVYSDGAEPTDADIETRTVTAADALSLELKGSGGAAIRFTPR